MNKLFRATLTVNYYLRAKTILTTQESFSGICLSAGQIVLGRYRRLNIRIWSLLFPMVGKVFSITGDNGVDGKLSGKNLCLVF